MDPLQLWEEKTTELKQKLTEALPGAHLREGNSEKEMGDLEKAIESYSKTIELKHDFAEAFFNRGLVYREKRDLEKAIADHQQAVNLDSTNSIFHYNLGYALESNEQFLEATKQYKECPDDDASANHHLGLCYMALKKFEEALEHLLKSTELSNELDHYHYEHAKCLRKLEKNDDAYKSIKKAQELSKISRYHFIEGEWLMEDKKFREAVESFTAAIKVDIIDTKNDSSYHHNKGLCLQKLGEFAEAAKSFQEAILLDPQKPEYSFELGVCQFELDDFTNAIDSFKQAEEKGFNKTSLLLPYRALALHQTGNVVGSVHDLVRIINEHPSSSPPLKELRKGVKVLEGIYKSQIETLKQELTTSEQNAAVYEQNAASKQSEIDTLNNKLTASEKNAADFEQNANFWKENSNTYQKNENFWKKKSEDYQKGIFGSAILVAGLLISTLYFGLRHDSVEEGVIPFDGSPLIIPGRVNYHGNEYTEILNIVLSSNEMEDGTQVFVRNRELFEPLNQYASIDECINLNGNSDSFRRVHFTITGQRSNLPEGEGLRYHDGFFFRMLSTPEYSTTIETLHIEETLPIRNPIDQYVRVLCPENPSTEMNCYESGERSLRYLSASELQEAIFDPDLHAFGNDHGIIHRKIPDIFTTEKFSDGQRFIYLNGNFYQHLGYQNRCTGDFLIRHSSSLLRRIETVTLTGDGPAEWYVRNGELISWRTYGPYFVFNDKLYQENE